MFNRSYEVEVPCKRWHHHLSEPRHRSCKKMFPLGKQIPELGFPIQQSCWRQRESCCELSGCQLGRTLVTVPPTLLLDSAILKEACEQIFLDLNKLVKTRNNYIHEKDYVSEWTSLSNRVEYMMCELHKLSLKAHDKALLDLQQWFKGVTVNMEEIELNRTLEKSRM